LEHLTRLSSFLAENEAKSSSPNTTYANAAILSSQFLLNQMMDDNHLVRNYMYINGTQACRYDDLMWTYNTGSVIESFMVLADVSGNLTWRDA
jgi:hypothetical protein